MSFLQDPPSLGNQYDEDRARRFARPGRRGVTAPVASRERAG